MRFTRAVTAVLALLFTVASFVSLQAQTTLTSTTLTTALGDTGRAVVVGSATNVAASSYLFIDREAMLIQSVSGTTAQVVRGFAGTAARAHSASSIVYTGTPSQFYQSEVSGTCTLTSEAVTPRIVLRSGNIYACTGGFWNRLGLDIGTVPAVFQQGGTAANAIDTIFFVADRPYLVSAIRGVWAVAETTGAMGILVKKLTGTTACASGTSLNTSIDATGTANTVSTATLTATAASLLLAAGDRLCVDLDATPNEVTMMTVTVTLVPR